MIYLTIGIVWGIIWGFATQSIIHNKGYSENWFWWGFFFGFIALIVALSKPEKHNIYSYNSNTENNDYINKLSSYSEKPNVVVKGEWKCLCGKTNANYVGSCGCGRTKDDAFGISIEAKISAEAEKVRISQKEEKVSITHEEELENKNLELLNLDILKKMKDLLDTGAITQEEFDIKKKELLGL